MATTPTQKTVCRNPAAVAVPPPPPPPPPSKNKKRGRPRKTNPTTIIPSDNTTEAAPPSKKRSSTTSTSSSQPTKPIAAPPPDDRDRCKRNGSSGWRCPFPRIPGKIFCNKHHQLKLINNHRARAAKNHASPAIPPVVETDAPASYPSPSTLLVGVGEIWALSHIAGGVPRAYGRIDRIIPGSARVELTPLVPHPASEEPGRIPACGTFRTSHPTTVKAITSLTHLVASTEEAAGKSFFEIFPNAGEVWAVYDHPKTGTMHHLAEIVSGYTEDSGVTAAQLVPAEGIGFRRELNGSCELRRTFMRKDLLWFSHRVPAVRSEEDGDDVAGSGGVLWQVFS